MVSFDMLSMPCSRLQSKPDYSTVPQLGQVTVLLPTATVIHPVMCNCGNRKCFYPMFIEKNVYVNIQLITCHSNLHSTTFIAMPV